MSKIQILSQNLINLIAAGEVVERPASALKELLENSVDAKATNIRVNLEDFGNKLIKIEDNGVGMDREDAHLAFRQHSTSKIINEEDLSNISTMGFRGEALASISAVAFRIILETKAINQEAIKLIIEQTNSKELPSKQTEVGTTISIENIFQNIPARKKFLKSTAVELKYLTNSFIEVALNNINIHFELYNNDKLIYRLPKSNNIRDRIFDLFGGNIVKNLYEENIVQSNLCKITILVGNPTIAKKSSPIQFAYVNDRFITSKVISSAITEGFKGFIHRDLKPTYFLLIHINPSAVDVNIHPRKLEVRFENTSEIFRLIFSIVKKTLEKNTKTLIRDNLSEISENPPTNEQNIFKNSLNNFNKEISSSNFKISDNNKENYFIKPKNTKIKEALFFTQALIGDLDKKPFNNADTSLHTKPIKIIHNSFIQIFKTYIVIDNIEKLIIIDQHAAAEKVLFEKLLKEYGSVKTKPLLIPQLINLNSTDKPLIVSKINDLKEIGIIIEDFGQNSITLTEIPEAINDFNINNYIDEILQPDKDIISTYISTHTYNDIKISKELFVILATTACHGSIRAGQSLSNDEMQKIINDLNLIENPYNCPHGRPTMWEISKYDIEKNFKRKI